MATLLMVSHSNTFGNDGMILNLSFLIPYLSLLADLKGPCRFKQYNRYYIVDVLTILPFRGFRWSYYHTADTCTGLFGLKVQFTNRHSTLNKKRDSSTRW